MRAVNIEWQRLSHVFQKFALHVRLEHDRLSNPYTCSNQRNGSACRFLFALGIPEILSQVEYLTILPFLPPLVDYQPELQAVRQGLDL